MCLPWEQGVLALLVETQRPVCPAELGTHSLVPGQSSLSLWRDSWSQACNDRWEVSLVVGPSRCTFASSLPLGCLITKQYPYFTVF